MREKDEKARRKREKKMNLLPPEQKPRSRCRSSDEECPAETKCHNDMEQSKEKKSTFTFREENRTVSDPKHVPSWETQSRKVKVIWSESNKRLNTFACCMKSYLNDVNFPSFLERCLFLLFCFRQKVLHNILKVKDRRREHGGEKQCNNAKNNHLSAKTELLKL